MTDGEERVKCHCIIAGFTQGRDRWHGPAELREKIVTRLGSKINPIYNRVWLYRWDERWKEVAKRIYCIGQRYEATPIVNVYAYSWGAGWGFTRLAKALRREGIKIRYAVLCDPVYRHWYFMGNWRAYSNFFGIHMPIKIPDNVEEVFWFRQQKNYPRSHRLKALSPETRIHPPINLDVTHSEADDHEFWHTRSVVCADRISG